MKQGGCPLFSHFSLLSREVIRKKKKKE